MSYPVVNKAALDVMMERQRQIDIEGWAPEEDDDKHRFGELAGAASCYAYGAYAVASDPDTTELVYPPSAWPWHPHWWKPGEPRRMLVKAGALILAEIDRLDRRTRESDDLVESRRQALESMGFTPEAINEMKDNLRV